MRRYSTRKREAIDILTKIFGTKEDKQLKEKAINFFKSQGWNINKIQVINQNNQKFIINGSDIYLVYNDTKDRFDAQITHQIEQFVVDLIKQFDVAISSFDRTKINKYLSKLKFFPIDTNMSFIRIK